MRKLVGKGFTLVMLMAFVLAMGVMTDAAMAADKMPVGPMKILVGPIHGGVRLLNTGWKSFWEGVRKYGPLGPVYAAVVTTVDTVENIPRTAANTVTIYNADNYNYDIGQMSPTAKTVASWAPPPLLPF